MTRNDNRDGAASVPVLPVRTLVLLPGVVAPIEVGRARSRAAVDAALASDGRILIVPQRDLQARKLTPDALVAVGVEAQILHSLPVAPQRYTVVVRAERRVRLGDYSQTTPYLSATAHTIETPTPAGDLEALVATARSQLAVVIDNEAEDPAKARAWLNRLDDASELADVVATRLELPRERLLAVLEQPDPAARLRDLLPDLGRRVEVLTVKASIRDELLGHLSSEQRAELLQQRMRAIQEELGEADDDVELAEFQAKVATAPMSDEARVAARRELRRLRAMSAQSAEYTTSKTYLDWLVSLPWQVEHADEIDMAQSRAILEADHEGVDKVKKRVLEYIAVRKLAPNKRAPILLLVGPPGVGKTSLGRSIAKALGREYVRASLGGVRDESEIRGHRRTYVGALPGRIAAGLKSAGSANPVFVLDEIDKLAAGMHGDPASALLEVLDPEQNDTFVDHYIEVPIDLSRVMFIATANTTETIPGPLLDRMEIVRIPGYTDAEKRRIAKHHLVPKELAEHGLRSDSVTLDDAALDELVRHYTREAGVRNLRREIAALCRSVAVDAATTDDWRGATLGVDDVRRVLGPQRFTAELAELDDAVGVATGMAWTPVGGEILFIEARLMPGKGNVHVTGQLGDVMSESVTTAHSWVRANAERLGIPVQRFQTEDLHVHLPAGSIKKDGPSAGTAMTTALVSLYTGVPVKHDVSITGEVTLRGLVLPVGGIKEKLLAAHRAGVTTAVLPERNRKDVDEIPGSVRAELNLVFAATVDDVLAVALRPPSEGARRPRRGRCCDGDRAAPMAA